MGEQETWSLGTALAIIERDADRVRVRLQGWVTAMAYEALHLRLALERVDEVELQLDHDALLMLTARSAVESALRGSLASGGPLVHLVVPGTRLVWALEHALLMTRAGQRRTARVMERAPQSSA